MAKSKHTVGEKLNDDNDTKIIEIDQFAALNKLNFRNPNKDYYSRKFFRFTKDHIMKFLSDPRMYEKELREAVVYMYGASIHFWRIINYFVGLTDWDYIVKPYRMELQTAKPATIRTRYRRVLNMLSSMNIKSQFAKILTVCIREDVYYGTMWVTSDNISIQRLPSDFCKISSVEGNVPNVSFNFRYFDNPMHKLEYFPEEFTVKYQQYREDMSNPWIELDSPKSFAVKCNDDILEYAIPPFAGLLRDLYDLEDYKAKRLDKIGLENYALLWMKLPMDDNGEWGIDLDKAKDFWMNLDNVMPPAVGTVLTPMDIEKISFERTTSSDPDTIADAEQHLFTAAGVSSLLFNNEKASANALAHSIKADQAITYKIVKNIEDVVNRYLHEQSWGKNFEVVFLDCSRYDQKEIGDQYLKSASYGFPTISAYAATQGIGQSDLDGMSYLEGEVLGLQDIFRPVVSSSQLNTEALSEEDAAGAPKKDVGELTDSGEQSREDGDDWG